MSESTRTLVIESPRYGKIEWILPEDVANRIVTLAVTDAEREEVLAFLGQTAAKVFGAVIFCFKFGKLLDLEALVIGFAKSLEKSEYPKLY